MSHLTIGVMARTNLFQLLSGELRARAKRLQLFCFFIEKCRKGHRHVRACVVMVIRNGVANGHRARQGEFQLISSMRTDIPDFVGMYRIFARDWTCYRWHIDHIAVVADTHLGFLVPVDTVAMFQKAMNEVDTELLAATDYIDACIFLLLQPDQRCIALARGFEGSERDRIICLQQAAKLVARDLSAQRVESD